MSITKLPGFHAGLLRCSFQHDHGTMGVVGLIAARTSGYGTTARSFFHCPSCGVAQNQRTRSEIRQYPDVDSAGDRGNLLPCGVCFKELPAFVFRTIKEQR